ncbi:phage terminase large subunit family protein, partial [Escherichia coli]|nr:phage terminase large subunit family protein [Escherichia coli]
AGLRSLFRPEPQTAVEWADANYYLPKESAYQEGRWEILPFQRAIMNAMGSDYIREVNVVKSARVGYPNTALVGVQVDSEQFGSQQVSRNYHLRGRILQVPSNYNPQTRQYSGIWDGTFKPAYSNNMAWCLWDMLTHPRYGMGKRLGAADVDKWALYVIGQCCDQSVPDGFGGTEPRITCNAYLTTQRKAWDVLSDFCS